MQSIPPASIACGREALGWESNIRNDIDETLGNYIKFCALCIYLFDYMYSVWILSGDIQNWMMVVIYAITFAILLPLIHHIRKNKIYKI